MFKLPDRGQYIVKDLDSYWCIVCPHHRGEAVIHEETRIDPSTGKPRMIRSNDPISGIPILEEVMFPIYSEKIGFDPECDACLQTNMETQQHIMAVKADKFQAEFEFQRDLKKYQHLLNEITSDNS